MANEYYDHTTYPANGAAGSSSTMRAEFDAVEAGLDKLPTLAGNGSKIVAVNAGATALEAITTTGTGSGVRATSPTFVTPTLGAATVTTINGMTITSSTGTFTLTNGKVFSVASQLSLSGTDGSSIAFGTGGTVAYTANKLSAFAATSSAELAGVISDETGSGALVFANTPTLVTPVLGVATATSINKVAITAPTSGATLTIADGATLTASASATVSGASSGTNTGDQNIFSTVAVSGQSDVVADSTSDTLTLAAGTNVSITTNASTDTITINATSPSASSSASSLYLAANYGGF